MLYHHRECTRQLTLCMLLTWLRAYVKVMKEVRESHRFVDLPKELNPLDSHRTELQQE